MEIHFHLSNQIAMSKRIKVLTKDRKYLNSKVPLAKTTNCKQFKCHQMLVNQ